MTPFASLIASVLLLPFQNAAAPPASNGVGDPGKPKDAGPLIVIDGDLDEWKDIKPAGIDPADAPQAFVDFGEVRLTHDGRFLSFLIDFGRNVNAQGLDGVGMVLFDSDGDPKTGQAMFDMPGIDFIVDLSPPSGKSYDKTGLGVGVRIPPSSDPAAGGPPPALNVYDVGLAFAPTYAARRMEFRINRNVAIAGGPAPLFTGKSVSCKLVYQAKDGSLADQTDVFTHELTPVSAAPVIDDPKDPLARAEGTDLRVLSWNAELGGIFTKPDPFIRTLKAVDPDVILLQELTDKNSAAQLRDFLARAIPPAAGEDWHVAFGEGGGNLRCGIATRLPLEAVDSLKTVAYPDQPKRSMRVIGAKIASKGHSLLVASLHLKCCGRADGPEDETRLTEAQAIHDAVKAVEAGLPGAAGVVIAGDFNLVGTRMPLETLQQGIDLESSALGLANPYQLDGLSNATWFDRHQPFVPARLDYMLYSDSSMKVLRSFICDSSDLAAKWLQAHGLQADDNEKASDHLPIVTDYRWLAHPVTAAPAAQTAPGSR